MLPRVLRFIAALVVAAVAWSSLTTFYDGVLAAAVTPLLKIDRRFRQARLTAHEQIITVASKEKRGEPPGADIPASELTYNVILLVALFASNRKPLRDRNVIAFGVSLAIIALLHLVGLFLAVEATYAVHMGEWSAGHYGRIAQTFWAYAEIFYRLVGMFGAVFLCWWLSLER